MCVVSLVTDHYSDKWRDRLPNTLPGSGDWMPNNPAPFQQPGGGQSFDPEQWKKMFGVPLPPAITAEEIAEFRALLARAREYDKRNHEPNCELREKQEALIAVAKALGVTITMEQLNG